LTDHKGEYAVIVKGEYIGAVPDEHTALNPLYHYSGVSPLRLNETNETV